METSKIPKVRTAKGFKKYTLKGIQLVPATSRFSPKNQTVTYYKIGNFSTGQNFYKYMTIDRALDCLENGTLHFVEPSVWEDQYESRFYNAIYDNVLNGKDKNKTCPLLYATCLTNKKENEPSWKIYSHGKKGACCVQLKLDRYKLREQIVNNINIKDCAIYEGAVSYFWQGFIDNMDRSIINLNEENELYSMFFNDFSRDKYLNLMLLKRDAFEHERETRIMIVPDNQEAKKCQGLHLVVKIDWGCVIKEIRYDSNCSKTKVGKLKSALHKISPMKKIRLNRYDINGEKKQIVIGEPRKPKPI